MRQFFKVVLASTVGTFLAFGFLFLMVASVLVAISSGGVDGLDPNMGAVRDKSVLLLNLDGTLQDKTSRGPLLSAIASYNRPPELDLFEISQVLDKAGQDDQVKGLLLHFKSLRSGLANAEALRRKIVEFKSSGKFVIAYSESYTELAYMIATAADEIVLYPKGYFEWDGLFSTVSYVKNTLQKLEVVPQVFRAGKYKSAIEPFISEKMSPESRQQIEEIISVAWGQIRKHTAEKTKLSEEELEDLAENAEVLTAEQAFQKGFVNLLASFEEIENKLVELTGVEDKPRYTHWSGYHKHSILPSLAGGPKEKVALLFTDGGISSQDRDGEGISSDSLVKVLDEIRRDEDIKAVVIRVNSPGGSALASDVIWTSSQWLKEAKPVVTSFGNVAASGGYYMSAGSQYIFAEPTTITGSIGVFGLSFATQDFWNKKIGMTFDTVKSHRFSDLESLVREFDPTERLKMQTMIDQIYDDFLGVVVKGRATLKDREQAHEIAQGRVWIGARAKEIGLVDELGGLDQAIAKVAELAELSSYKVEIYPKPKSTLEQFMAQIGEVSVFAIQSLIPEGLQTVFQQSLITHKKEMKDQIMTRLPFDIVIE